VRLSQVWRCAPDGGLLMLGSSVHRKRGYMYRQYKKLHGSDDADGICWFAPSAVMNPLLPVTVVDAALAEDAPKARAEYQNVWREDLSDFVPLDVIESCTAWGVHERAPQPGVQYYAFADCAGGTGSDSFGFVISSRRADDQYTVEVIRERRPRFIPSAVISELASLCKMYGISEVQGDKYAVGFHEQEWRTHGIRFVPCERTTSENYLNVLPLLLAKRVSLLDSSTLRSQLSSLERRVGANDRETVSHPQHASAHDDVSCACCGALAAIAKPKYRYDCSMSWVSGPDNNAAQDFLRARFHQHLHGYYGRYWR
jgi:hypothetical protein